ncbi:hypothetical protein JG687_00014988 [Phytophthora cactorum]|uniref:Uncharacterized protein n=1 Tax=Phytophthora cactorum TaxID=29920 RepID=A0A8T1U036_9STRA|nr:hypothetical protein JG687_00014988 [Phytophthora cactorum]
MVEDESTFIVDYTGEEVITDSPLVQNVLKGSTALRDDTIYLVTNKAHSSTSCTAIEGFDSTAYGNLIILYLFYSLQKHAVDDLKYIVDLKLIAPVVDCAFDLLVSSDETVTQLSFNFNPELSSGSTGLFYSLPLLLSTCEPPKWLTALPSLSKTHTSRSRILPAVN